MLALGVFGTGFAFLIHFRNIRLVGASAASLVTYLVPVFAVLVGVIVLTFVGGGEEDEAPAVASSEPFDAFAGGYPVPPQGDQQLPELAGVLAGEGEEQAPPPRRAARPMPGSPEQTTPDPTREEQS